MRRTWLLAGILGIFWGMSIAGDVRALTELQGPQVAARISRARVQLGTLPASEQSELRWRITGARRLGEKRRAGDAMAVADGRKPASWTTVHAGDLGMILEQTPGGIVLASLHDSGSDQELAGSKVSLLLRITIRRAEGAETTSLTAVCDWKQAEIAAAPAGSGTLDLRWRSPADGRFGDLGVTVQLVPEPIAGAFRWSLSVVGVPRERSVWRVVFPQLAVADLGPIALVFLPSAAGEVQRGVWRRAFKYTGAYPSGWCSMPFMAAYDESRRTGLTITVRDPWGTKDLHVESKPDERAVIFEMDDPAPGIGTSGNGFALGGTSEWLLCGDWFDAAIACREWVRREAKWSPKSTDEGRAETPRWMRELSVWALSGGPSGEYVPAVREFNALLGSPTAVPCVALPAVTKNEEGEPYLELFGSGEQHGRQVQLGVMCPSTGLWQRRVSVTVLRLMNECAVSGVYIDQIAAAAPALGFDASHGHSVGGGHRWAEGYWKFMEEIRRSMTAGRMLTTECNGEQVGRIGSDRFRDRDQGAYFRRLMLLWRKLASYFYAGEMARLPQLVGNVPTVRADWQWNEIDRVTTNAVITGAWHQSAARRVVLVYVNVSDDPVTAPVQFNPDELGLSAPKFQVIRIVPEGADGAVSAGTGAFQ